MFTVGVCSIVRDLFRSLQVQLHSLNNLFEVTNDHMLGVPSYYHHGANFLPFSLILIAKIFCDSDANML